MPKEEVADGPITPGVQRMGEPLPMNASAKKDVAVEKAAATNALNAVLAVVEEQLKLLPTAAGESVITTTRADLNFMRNQAKRNIDDIARM